MTDESGKVEGGKVEGNGGKTVGKAEEGRNFKAGIAVGIGSAAIVAALLYARAGKPRKK